MSVEGPIEPPLRVTDLADVDSPDVVRAALARFRRRAIIWALWIAAAVVVAVVLLPSYRGRTDPRTVFLRAPGLSIGAVVKQGPLQAVVLEAVRLNKQQFGVHLIITDESLRSDETIMVALAAPSLTRWEGQIPNPGFDWGSRDSKASDEFFVGSPGQPVVTIPLTIVRTFPGIAQSTNPPRQTYRQLTIRIDLRRLAVPSWIWR